MNTSLQLVAVKGVSHISSILVADVFGRRHTHVIRQIEKLIEDGSLLIGPLCGRITYQDSRNREQTQYVLTEAGFCALMRSFNLKEQAHKDLYRDTIKKFHTRQSRQLRVRNEFGTSIRNVVPNEAKSLIAYSNVDIDAELEEDQKKVKIVELSKLESCALMYEQRTRIAAGCAASERKYKAWYEAALEAMDEDSFPQPEDFGIDTEYSFRFKNPSKTP